MGKQKLDSFKKQLETMRDTILNEAGKTISEMTDSHDNITHPNDRATPASDRSFELRIRDRERKLLSKIEEALERIDEGDFGVCDGCGEMIGTKRLEARPVTTYCIDCKTEQEQREKAQGK